jgi:hypothetical protein
LLFVAAADSKFLKTLLSFAVGGLLGDVFLHLLPEAWENDMNNGSGEFEGFFTFSLLTILHFKPATIPLSAAVSGSSPASSSSLSSRKSSAATQTPTRITRSQSAWRSPIVCCGRTGA